MAANVLSLSQGSTKFRTKLEKNKEKKGKIQFETFKQKGHTNSDIVKDLRDIIKNISDEQDPVSTSLKAVISKLKKRNKLIKIADSTEGGLGSCSRIQKRANWERFRKL